MSDPSTHPSSVTVPDTREPRSGGAVLAMLGVLVAVPLLVVVVLVLIRGVGSGGAADAAVVGVRDDRIQSVELTNGRILFGTLEASSGDWLVLRDAYFLRRTAAAATGADAEADADTPKGGTEIVSIVAEQGGDGDVVLNASELVSFQNLASNSDIGSEIEDATR